MMGHAAREAAERARERIAEAVGAAARRARGSGSSSPSAGSSTPADPARGLAWEEAVIAAEARYGTLASTGSYTPPRSPGKYRGAGVGPSPTYSYSAAVVEVEVDPATGVWRPLEVWMAHDIGRAINPALVMGQVEGIVYMGLGEAMMEESAFRRLPRRARRRSSTSSRACSSTRASPSRRCRRSTPT